MPLADYAIESEIGRGGMGRVVLATHVPTGVKRAVKVLAIEGNAEAIARFQRECEALARARTAGAVPIHETGLDQGRFWFSMDLLEGGSLRDLMKRRGPLPWREAASLVAKLARMAERCHELGLVHRDLKPENVLFDASGNPCLADFGCVRDLSGRSLTVTGETIGTPDYMAPEQLNGQRVDGRADVFSLGVILYELVAGERPFRAPTWNALLLAMNRRERRPLADLEAEAAVARALEPRPDARPTARELALLLGGPGRAPATGNPWPLRFVAAGLVTLGVAFLGAALARRPHGPPAPPGRDPAPVATQETTKPRPALDPETMRVASESIAALAKTLVQVSTDGHRPDGQEMTAATEVNRRLTALRGIGAEELAPMLGPLEAKLREILSAPTSADAKELADHILKALDRALAPVAGKETPLLRVAPAFFVKFAALDPNQSREAADKLEAYAKGERSDHLLAALAYDHAAEIVLHHMGHRELSEYYEGVELLGNAVALAKDLGPDDATGFGHRARHRWDYLKEAHRALLAHGPEAEQDVHRRGAVAAVLATVDAEGADDNTVHMAFKTLLELRPEGKDVEAFVAAHSSLDRDMRFIEYVRVYKRDAGGALERGEKWPRKSRSDELNLAAMRMLALMDLGRNDEARVAYEKYEEIRSQPGNWEAVLDYLGPGEMGAKARELRER